MEMEILGNSVLQRPSIVAKAAAARRQLGLSCPRAGRPLSLYREHVNANFVNKFTYYIDLYWGRLLMNRCE